MSDLTLISTKELIDELDRRFDALVVLSQVIRSDKNDELTYHFKNKINCLGMMTLGVFRLNNSYIDDEKAQD